MSVDIESVYREVKAGQIKQETVNEIIQQGFDDYNNDYHSEICAIVRAILKDKKIVIAKEQVGQFLNVVINEASIYELFNHFEGKELEYSNKDIENIFDNMEKTVKNKEEFFKNIFERVELSDLLKLKILVKDKEVGQILLGSKNVSISPSIKEFVQQHYFYSTLKDIDLLKTHEQDNEQHLTKELLKLENRLTEVDKEKTRSIEGFLSRTYKMVFDESNENRNKFSMEFAEKEIQKAIATYEYEKSYFSKSKEELQKSNPNSPFRIKRKM